jgi:hypothetical protein
MEVTHMCPRCGTKNALDVYQKVITTPPSGPFIIGHIGGILNLPMIGASLHGGTMRIAYLCKACGEEVWEISAEEQMQWQKMREEIERKERKNKGDEKWKLPKATRNEHKPRQRKFIKVSIVETVITTNVSDDKSSEIVSTVIGTVLTRGQSQFQIVCDHPQSIANSHATTETNGVRVEARHNATCKELQLDKQEVSVECITSGAEYSIYLIKLLKKRVGV